MNQVLRSVGINPNTVLDVKEIKQTCPWCLTICGSLVYLLPCKHSFCESCAANIVDMDISTCSVCNLEYEDIQTDYSTENNSTLESSDKVLTPSSLLVQK